MENVLHQIKIQTPIGEMIAVANSEGLCLLEFNDRKELAQELDQLVDHFNGELIASKNEHLIHLEKELTAYFEGKLQTFSVPLVFSGTTFQVNVWHALGEIPYGEMRTYKEQSEHLGDVKAIRAVASANGKNKLAIIVPCHRVIGTNGNLTGYAGGIERKRFLLDLERKFGGPKDLFNSEF